MALNHSFEFLSHYLYLLGALQQISSPRRQSRIFGNAILKNFIVLYHVKIWWPNDAQRTLNFWYVVCNKHDNKPAKIKRSPVVFRNLWPRNAGADSLSGPGPNKFKIRRTQTRITWTARLLSGCILSSSVLVRVGPGPSRSKISFLFRDRPVGILGSLIDY